MIHIAEVLKELGISNYALEKIPSTEDEFKKYFKKVVGEDSSGSAILSDDESKFGVTWKQITDKKQELQIAYNSNEYQRKRASEYPSIEDQLDDLYHNGIDGWKSTIKTIKDKYPKG